MRTQNDRRDDIANVSIENAATTRHVYENVSGRYTSADQDPAAPT